MCDSEVEEVDIMRLWPEEEKNNLTSAKWSERKESLECLLGLLERNPRIASHTLTIYGELMDELKKILIKDSNVVVVQTALKVLTAIARSLKHRFANFITMLYAAVLDKAKDKKQNVRDAVGDALDAMSATCDGEKIINYLEEFLGKPSPQSKQCILAFLYRYFITWDKPNVPFIKAIVPKIVKLATDSDATVREQACLTLGSSKRVLGPNFDSFCQSIAGDKIKMEKIEEGLKQANEARIVLETSYPSNGNLGSEAEVAGESATTADDNDPSTMLSLDPFEDKTPIDIVALFPNNWSTEILEKKWQTKKDLLEICCQKMDNEPRIEPNAQLDEFISTVLKVLEKDINVNVCAFAAKTLARICKGLQYDYAKFASKSMTICLDRIKDKKAVLQTELIAFIHIISEIEILENYAEAVNNALLNKNPQVRVQTASFLATFFAKNDRKTLSIEGLKILSSNISKCCSDADQEVRENSLKSIASLCKCLGEDVTKSHFLDVFNDKLKADKITSMIPSLKEEFGTVATPQMKRLSARFGNKNTEAQTNSRPNSAPNTKQRPAAVSRRPVPTSNTASRPSRPVTTATSRPLSAATSKPASRSSSTTNKAPIKIAPARPATATTTKPSTPLASRQPRPPTMSARAPMSARQPVTKAPLKPNVTRTVPSTTVTSKSTSALRPVVPPVATGIRPPVRPTGISRPPGTATSGIRPPTAAKSGLRPPTRTGIPVSSQRVTSRPHSPV